jgi:putative MATE family efflux protein
MSVSSSQKGKSFSAIASLLRQALSSNHQDYTTGSIRRAVVLLSVPMILEMCMESVFALVDIFFVSRISKEAVAAVGLTESVLAIVYSVAMGLGMAATAMVARRIGEKNETEASHSAAQAILICLGLTVVISLAGAAFAPHLLKVMGASDATVRVGTPFTRIIFSGSIVIMMLFLINGVFRGAGNASTAMWALWIANGCNIILCPLLIHFYGLPGAAMATTIGRGIGVCYQLYHLIKRTGVIRIIRKQFQPDGMIIRGLLKIAWTGAAQFLIGSGSWIVMAMIIARFGDTVIAGYQVAIRIIIFFLLPAWGMSNAAATLVGQNLGAGRVDRAEQSVRTASTFNVIFSLLVTLILLFLGGYIVSFINPDPSIGIVSVRALQIIAPGYVFYGIGMVMTNAFNGAGDTRTPTIVNFFCFWTFQIPLAWLLAIGLGFGPKGVFFAIVITETTISIVSFLLFRRGGWKRVKV